MARRVLASLLPRAPRDSRPQQVRMHQHQLCHSFVQRRDVHTGQLLDLHHLRAERSKAAKHKSVGQRAAKREFKAPGADSLIAQRLTSKEVCQADYYHLAELMVRQHHLAHQPVGDRSRMHSLQLPPAVQVMVSDRLAFATLRASFEQAMMVCWGCR